MGEIKRQSPIKDSLGAAGSVNELDLSERFQLGGLKRPIRRFE